MILRIKKCFKYLVFNVKIFANEQEKIYFNKSCFYLNLKPDNYIIYKFDFVINTNSKLTKQLIDFKIKKKQSYSLSKRQRFIKTRERTR